MNNLTIIKLSELSIHPENNKIYEEKDADAELVSSIANRGLINPLVVDENKQIVSGARRYLALCKLADEGKTEFEEVQAMEQPFEGNEVVSFIVESNLHRSKSWEQKVREGWAIHDLVKKEAKYNQFKGLQNVDLVPENYPERSSKEEKEVGETFDRIAKRVGLENGKAYHQYSRLLKSTNMLSDDKKEESARQLKELANKSVRSALYIIDNENYALLDVNPSQSKTNVLNDRAKLQHSFKVKQWINNATKLLTDAFRLSESDPGVFEELQKECPNELQIESSEDELQLTLTSIKTATQKKESPKEVPVQDNVNQEVPVQAQ